MAKVVSALKIGDIDSSNSIIFWNLPNPPILLITVSYSIMICYISEYSVSITLVNCNKTTKIILFDFF
jgi:hypothetical protein